MLRYSLSLPLATMKVETMNNSKERRDLNLDTYGLRMRVFNSCAYGMHNMCDREWTDRLAFQWELDLCICWCHSDQPEDNKRYRIHRVDTGIFRGCHEVHTVELSCNNRRWVEHSLQICLCSCHVKPRQNVRLRNYDKGYRDEGTLTRRFDSSKSNLSTPPRQPND